MKKILITLLVLTSGLAWGQQKSYERKIEVQGQAEKEIIPNEFDFRIALKEYKDGSKKTTINELESQLVKSVKKLGIKEENLQVENIYGYNWDWKKKESDEFLATKSFIIKLSDLKQLNNLLAMLDPEGINSTSIQNYSHTEIEKYMDALKIEALKKAKHKAEVLLGALNEEVGPVIEVQDINYGYNRPVLQRTMAYEKTAGNDYQSNLDFKAITIKAEIRVVFSIL